MTTLPGVYADPCGRPFLFGQPGKPGLLSFDPDGLDFRPGRPATSIAKGVTRGTAKLRNLEADEHARMAPAQLTIASVGRLLGQVADLDAAAFVLQDAPITDSLDSWDGSVAFAIAPSWQPIDS